MVVGYWLFIRYRHEDSAAVEGIREKYRDTTFLRTYLPCYHSVPSTESGFRPINPIVSAIILDMSNIRRTLIVSVQAPSDGSP